ncbi:hypothetical protein RJT34_30396 [Clitoria ternatea]|uniref:Uncharacterized protein n=1 Tax=Clitoria ternatea TaxID=43366 RepID=A0AAN9EWX3_CLITE
MLQKLRVDHFDSPVPRTPARDPSQRLSPVFDALTPLWKTEANFDYLGVRNQGRQDLDQQVEDAHNFMNMVRQTQNIGLSGSTDISVASS